MASAGTACTGGSQSLESASVRRRPGGCHSVVTQAWRRSCVAARQVTALQVFDANCWCGTIGLSSSTRCSGAGRTADLPFFRPSGLPVPVINSERGAMLSCVSGGGWLLLLSPLLSLASWPDACETILTWAMTACLPGF